ncbi:MAG TPA: hypothetical protein EYQ70_00895 [Marine Group III euryarchaeote]|uniref:Uncharacterized protein n=1 Tax=Marine Group III euryarchaeote TaxID=2173149 RepID=A0A7J4GTW6_9ARCH|nr:hypothetical protein [Marine Group III euryarchaeote]
MAYNPIEDLIIETILFLIVFLSFTVYAILKWFVQTTEKVMVKTKDELVEKSKIIIQILRPHKALIAIANNPDNNELTTISNNDNSIEWIDIECKNNKKLYDTKGNVIVIGTPSPKIHAMATYDINGNIIEDSSVKVRHDVKKVIFMDPEDKKDEKGKLKKLYEGGYISRARYNSLMGDLNK